MKSLDDLKKLRDEALKRMNMRYVKNGYRIQVGMGTCGIASGAKPILSAFLELVEYSNLNNVTVTQVGCMGECAFEPMVEIIDEAGQSFVYCNVTKDMVSQIIEKHIKSSQPIDKYLLSTRKG